MNTDEIDHDLRQAVEERLSRRLADTRARRERRAAFVDDKAERRRRGLRRRHVAKLKRGEITR